MKKVGRKANPSPYSITRIRISPRAAPFKVAGHPEQPTAGPAFRAATDCATVYPREIMPGQLSRHAFSAAAISLSLMEMSRE